MIGYFEAPLNKLLTASKQTLKGDLFFDDENGKKTKKDRGKIILKAESVADINHEFKCIAYCSLVPRKGKWNLPFLRGNPDNPKLTIYRPTDQDDELDDSNWIEVYSSEVYPQETRDI